MENTKIAIIGLGYVGLPLAVEFGKSRAVTGFDINQKRIDDLRAGQDKTREVEAEELAEATHLSFTSDPEQLRGHKYYIVTVPTPIDSHKQPDLSPLINASRMLGKVIAEGAVIIYESTVYPGCTEEVCVPELETNSGLIYNKGFYCGYSPERINPGDKVYRLPAITKVTSGSTPAVAEEVDQLYKSIITAGTFKASSIKVAEAAKVIENSQRDINIAFVNELALIFDRIGIDTREVLQAAGTKWNFLPFTPGLVGGHCIGVDPYYLTYKAESLQYMPEVILSGRKINDGMGAWVATKMTKLMASSGMLLNQCKVLVLGITFKENVPDIRNSRVIDVVRELQGYGIKVDIYDPHADHEEVREEYGVDLVAAPQKDYQGVILAVAHKEFEGFDPDEHVGDDAVIYDIKGLYPRDRNYHRL